MSDLVKVTVQEVSDAYVNFTRMYFPDKQGVGHYFWAFLGMTKYPSPIAQGTHWMLPEDAAHRVHLLAGPHYQTVAKAMIANGLRYDKQVE